MKKLFGRISRRVIVLILIVLVIVGFFSQRLISSKNKGFGRPVTIKRQTLKDVLTFSGEINADDRATLQFQTGGLLSWVGVKEGDTVKKGQLLASLDQSQLKKTLEKDLNTYAKSRLDFDNQKQSYNEKGLPGDKYLRQNLIDAYQKAQYDLNNSVLDVELQNISLQYSSLVSPIDGVVTSSGYKNAGTNIAVTTPGIEVINPETIYFSAAADQTEVTKLTPGMESEITFDAFPEEKQTGMIKSIGFTPKAGETGTVYEVKVTVSGASQNSQKYRIGMTGDSNFTLLEHQNALSAPTTYIHTEGSHHYVYKMSNGKIVKTEVETGHEFDTDIEITSGLQEGDVIYDKTQ